MPDKKKILLIDDETRFTGLLKMNLERTGSFDVVAVNQSEQGLLCAKQFRPDLILLDVMMPGMDGGTLAAQLRADEEMQHVPIMFLTAVLSKEEAQTHGGKLSGYPCIAKPISTAEMIQQIERQLGRLPTRGAES